MGSTSGAVRCHGADTTISESKESVHVCIFDDKFFSEQTPCFGLACKVVSVKLHSHRIV